MWNLNERKASEIRLMNILMNFIDFLEGVLEYSLEFVELKMFKI